MGLGRLLEVHEAHQQTLDVSGPGERVKGQAHMPEVLLVTVGIIKSCFKKGKKDAWEHDVQCTSHVLLAGSSLVTYRPNLFFT